MAKKRKSPQHSSSSGKGPKNAMVEKKKEEEEVKEKVVEEEEVLSSEEEIIKNNEAENDDSDEEEEKMDSGSEQEEEENYNDEKGDDEDEELVEEETNNNNYDEAEMLPAQTTAVTEAFSSDGKYRNKKRCLVLCSRGVTARYRHLLEDLRTLIPHHKKESKLDQNGAASAVNDILQVRSCTSVLFLECRKRQDCYMWLGLTSGPSVKFHVTNVHTMDELRLTGNCLKGSRPILTFDESFGRMGHLKLLKELFVSIFGTPRGHPKSKPFVDRIMGFYYADHKVWVRNYQIVEQQAFNAKEAHEAKKESGQSLATSLVEIGPRFVLDPIRIFRGSFGGQTLYENPHYTSPNTIRSQEMKKRGRTYEERKDWQKQKKAKERELVLPEDPLADVFR